MNTGNQDAIQIDSDGYPLDGVADVVSEWPWQDMPALFERLAEVWPHYGRFEQRSDGTWEIVTGGWSGCEELVGALMRNTTVRMFAWKLSKRGGYFEFEVPAHLVSDKQER